MRGNPIRFRWIVAITLTAWEFMAGCFWLKVIPWKEFAFIHTVLLPIVMFVAIVPFSIKSVTAAKLRQPFVAIWSGTMVPLTYLTVRQATGFGNHCDFVFMSAGGLLFSVFMTSWLIERSLKRRNLEVKLATT